MSDGFELQDSNERENGDVIAVNPSSFSGGRIAKLLYGDYCY